MQLRDTIIELDDPAVQAIVQVGTNPVLDATNSAGCV
jgi:hypothetical protein